MRISLSGNDCQLISPFLDIIRERLSVSDPAANFTTAYNSFSANRIYLMSKTGRFKLGLLWYVIGEIKKMELPDTVDVDPEVITKCNPKFSFHDQPLAELKFTPHEYQEASVRRMLKVGRGVLNIGTGGGKTYTFALYLATLRKYGVKLKTMILVPTLGLVEQTYLDLIEYGFKESEVSKWSGKNPRQDTDIVVAFSDFTVKHKQDTKFFKSFKQVIVDECHILKKANGINNIMNIFDTDTRFGFTGTTPENIWDEWNMIGQTGSIIYKKDSKSLRDGGYIANLYVNVVRVNYNNRNLSRYRTILANVPDKKQQFIAEMDFLVDNHFRNGIIEKISTVAKNNTLILVDRVAHGKTIYDMLSKSLKNRKIFWIHGKTKAEVREKIRNLMEEFNDIICIAMAKLFSVGINVKNLHYIIFASAGKAKVKIVQTLGRGLRKHPRKDVLRVYDLSDILKYGVRHLTERVNIYDNESIEYAISDIMEP